MSGEARKLNSVLEGEATPTTNSTEQAEGWVAHDGGVMPVTHGTIVQIRIRNGIVSAPEDAQSWDWRSGKRKSRFDIIAYRIVEAS